MTGNNGRKSFMRDWQDRRLDLSTRIAVITGAARGIGRATAQALARDGIKAAAVVDQLDQIVDFADEANEFFGRKALVPFKGDVTSSDFRRHVFEEMQSLYGPVSICVPAAGITGDRLAVKINSDDGQIDIYPEEQFERIVEVNLTAPVYWALQTIASVAQYRHEQGLKMWQPEEHVQGCIVFIGSVSSGGNRGQISYATTKAGLEGAQGTLSAEAIFHGMRCAIIHPGFTDTAMVRAMGEQFINDHILPQTQLRRLILPEEIADAICFLIRNASVSGQLWADAGWHPASS